MHQLLTQAALNSLRETVSQEVHLSAFPHFVVSDNTVGSLLAGGGGKIGSITRPTDAPSHTGMLIHGRPVSEFVGSVASETFLQVMTNGNTELARLLREEVQNIQQEFAKSEEWDRMSQAIMEDWKHVHPLLLFSGLWTKFSGRSIFVRKQAEGLSLHRDAQSKDFENAALWTFRDSIQIFALSAIFTTAIIRVVMSEGRELPIKPIEGVFYSANFAYMLGYDMHHPKFTALTEFLDLYYLLHVGHSDSNGSQRNSLGTHSCGSGLFAAMSSMSNALVGFRHGGAAKDVLEMLLRLQDRLAQAGPDGRNNVLRAFIRPFFEPGGPNLTGYGHKELRIYDVRATAMRRYAEERGLVTEDSLIALALEFYNLVPHVIAEVKGPENVPDLAPNVDALSGATVRAFLPDLPASVLVLMFGWSRCLGACADAFHDWGSGASLKRTSTTTATGIDEMIAQRRAALQGIVTGLLDGGDADPTALSQLIFNAAVLEPDATLRERATSATSELIAAKDGGETDSEVLTDALMRKLFGK